MSYADEVEAYGAYRNALAFARLRYDASELERFEQDLAKAKACDGSRVARNDPNAGRRMSIELSDEEARALAAYIAKRGFDYEESATIGVILEKCRDNDTKGDSQ